MFEWLRRWREAARREGEDANRLAKPSEWGEPPPDLTQSKSFPALRGRGQMTGNSKNKVARAATLLRCMDEP